MVERPKKEKCPDCQECQMCSETRCRLCKEGGCGKGDCELGSSFTYGDYLKWKRNKSDETGTRRVPFIDRAGCTDCESCLSLCPALFRRNEDTGHIEVADVSEYPEEQVREVMSMCPGKCIELIEE